MLKFENAEVVGWEHAIRGMRNPHNSWAKSDTGWHDFSEYWHGEYICVDLDAAMINFIGGNDMTLMKKLIAAGTDHRKFMRMITVYVDITGPLYWWSEFDTYKVGTVANSCSKMHTIADKEFTLDDFSHEHLSDYNRNVVLEGVIIKLLNAERHAFLETGVKDHWWQMIQLLPSSYNQKRTIMLNYEVLANIYKSRKNHKLDEWSVDFMNWIENLPYSTLITGKEKQS